MRIRFSLRSFFLLTTLFACFCYIWLIRPTAVAGRFAQAIHNEDYHAADEALRPNERFLADWAEKRWAFRSRCHLHPLTFGQLVTGRRYVTVQLNYFEFDHNADQQASLTATPLGLGAPTISSVRYGARFIDAVRDGQPVER
jgi:hypothetical protein